MLELVSLEVEAVGVEDRCRPQPVGSTSGRFQHVAPLVGAEFGEDHLKLRVQHVEHPSLHRMLADEVERPHRVDLSDAVDPTDALLETARRPRKIPVHDHMSELEVDALSPGVGAYEYLDALPEGFLGQRPFAQGHRAVDRHRRHAGRLQQLQQHLLGGDELGEDQDLDFRILFRPPEFPEQGEEGTYLGVRAGSGRGAGKAQQVAQFAPFGLPRRASCLGEGLVLLFAGEVSPVLVTVNEQQQLFPALTKGR